MLNATCDKVKLRIGLVKQIRALRIVVIAFDFNHACCLLTHSIGSINILIILVVISKARLVG